MTKAAGRTGKTSAGAKSATVKKKKAAKTKAAPQSGTRKPWGGRFSGATDPAVERFSASIDFDKALARHDIRGSRAQARMLGDVGLIPIRDARELLRGLDLVEAEIESGRFPFDPALEDIHMNIETRLRTLVGPDVAGKLHTGRSRNDQVATDLALFLRDAGLATQRGLHTLRAVLIERAREHVDTILPGYTHLQRAQPVRLAHHWLAHVEVLGRDAGRFADARARIDRSPLGAGALAGSTLPLDREQTAAELGFEGPTRNSMDTVASRDAALEYLAAAAIAMVHLSRLAEEITWWSNPQFGFVRVADAFSTGSSMMPNKRNPDPAELVRGRSGAAIGAVTSILTVLKGLPLAYQRDLQEDKPPLFAGVRALEDSLEVMAGLVDTLAVDRPRMREAADAGYVTATSVADALVRAGVPFRSAHHVVGTLVAAAEGRGVSLDAVTDDEIAAALTGADDPLAADLASDARIGSTVRNAATVEGALAVLDVHGGSAPNRVREQLTTARSRLGADSTPDTGSGNRP